MLKDWTWKHSAIEFGSCEGGEIEDDDWVDGIALHWDGISFHWEEKGGFLRGRGGDGRRAKIRSLGFLFLFFKCFYWLSHWLLLWVNCHIYPGFSFVFPTYKWGCWLIWLTSLPLLQLSFAKLQASLTMRDTANSFWSLGANNLHSAREANPFMLPDRWCNSFIYSWKHEKCSGPFP